MKVLAVCLLVVLLACGLMYAFQLRYEYAPAAGPPGALERLDRLSGARALATQGDMALNHAYQSLARNAAAATSALLVLTVIAIVVRKPRPGAGPDAP